MSVRAIDWPVEGGPLLVVEDDAFVGQLLEASLAKLGYAVNLVSSGSEALAGLLAGAVPSCIVTDLHMPGLNGFELLRSIRASDALRDVPVIVLSGFDDKADIEAAFKLGATSFVSKPVDPVLLDHHIRMVLRAVRAV